MLLLEQGRIDLALFIFFVGVQFDIRKLQLGDFLWVARERTVPTPGTMQLKKHS